MSISMIDCQERAREAFKAMFKPEYQDQETDWVFQESANETEHEAQKMEDERLEVERRIIRVFKKDAQKPVPRKKGWLYREMKEVKS